MAFSFTHSILMLIFLLSFVFDLRIETMAHSLPSLKQPPSDSRPLCHDDERAYLLDFMKETFNATTWIFNDASWVTYNTGGYDNVECCSWSGVDCDQLTGHVIGIEADQVKLRFEYNLPTAIHSNSSIFRLIHLKNLLLHSIDFKYLQIPDSITNLTSLESLTLSNCNISGVIPSFLRNFTQLSVLDLSYNEFTTQEIPLFIRNMTQLEKLSFSGNNLYLMNNINVFANLNKLTFLGMDNTNLNSLFKITNNSFTLPSSLEILRLHYCKLNHFPSFLRNMKNLRALYLASNNIHGKIPIWFMSASTKYLEYLDLSNNSLIGFEKPYDHLPLPWRNLKHLDISHNLFKGLLPIPPICLEHYKVSENKFFGQILPFFCNVNSSSFYFDVSSNFLSGIIPQCFKNLANILRILDLSNNSFVGQIPEIGERTCNQIHAIDVSFNQLHGPIPQWLANCKELEFIFLKNNKFEDHLPRWFSSLKSLQIVDLSQNQLQGIVPKTWANCKELEFFNIGDNQIKDYFPSWLGQLPKLRALLLRSNKFHGSIRINDLGGIQFDKLRLLDISFNYFVGHFPLKLFTHLNAMKFVRQKNKAFEMMIVSSLDITVKLSYKGAMQQYEKVLDALVILDCSNNHFIENIPQVLGDLRGLIGLNLSNNILTGNIPSSLGKLSELEYLDLSQNKLSGNITRELTHLDNLGWLSLSHNQLSGPIPKGAHFDTLINGSIVGNVGLCGEPLLKKCFNETPQHLRQESESVAEIEWNIVGMGFGTGIIIGFCLGYLWKNKWFVRIVRKKLKPK